LITASIPSPSTPTSTVISIFLTCETEGNHACFLAVLMVVGRADQPVRHCIHPERSGSGHDTTMHGEIGTARFRMYFSSIISWSENRTYALSRPCYQSPRPRPGPI
jgi:hypothetical protein